MKGKQCIRLWHLSVLNLGLLTINNNNDDLINNIDNYQLLKNFIENRRFSIVWIVEARCTNSYTGGVNWHDPPLIRVLGTGLAGQLGPGSGSAWHSHWSIWSFTILVTGLLYIYRFLSSLKLPLFLRKDNDALT